MSVRQKQLQELAGTLVRYQHCFNDLPTEHCQWVIKNPGEAIALFVEVVRNHVSDAVEKLFEFVTTVETGGVALFVAAEKFRPGKTIDGIKVGWIGSNFKEHLLPKIESNEVVAEELVVNKLLKNSRDPDIITALGGEEKVEISLGQFWEFLKTADQNFWYIAYIRDTESVLWAVNASWLSNGLRVEACSLGSPAGWNAGRRFLSR